MTAHLPSPNLDEAMDVKAIPIELIRLDGGTQIRDCKTQQTKVEEYLAAMMAGAKFPPLTVFWDGADYWLADGFHRLGANNIFMQALELPGLDVECEVLEGTRRDAILFACGTNAEHGIPRTNTDKQNAVETMLKNPLVSLNDDGVPWSDRDIAKICKVSPPTVAKWRAEYLKKFTDSPSEGAGGSEERAVTRGGTTYTMNTANIGRSSPKAAAAGSVPAAPEPDAGASLQTAVVVEFSSKWDFIYDRLKEIDRAVAALPAPDVAAARFPETLAHGLPVGRCLEIQRWLQEFARLWAARGPETRRIRASQHDMEEILNVTSR